MKHLFQPRTRAYLQLHIAVLLYGLTAILGDLISISAVSLVWWRVLITSASLLFFIGFGRQLLQLQKHEILAFTGIGFIIAAHWLTFYGAIKLSNASIVLAAMSTASLFTSVIEPMLTDKPFRRFEFIVGLLIVPPLLIIANNIDFSMMDGLLMAILSALLAAIFATLNKKLVHKASAYQITFLEMLSALVIISVALPFVIDHNTPLMPVGMDWVYLIILSLACTTFAFIISLYALKEVSAFEANLVINLEPVYGIFLAIVILKEHHELSLSFYIAVVFILLIVFLHPILTKKLDQRYAREF